MSLKELCHCGHSVSTHYWDQDGISGDCLGMGCDDCHGYQDASKPPVNGKRPRRPDHTSACQCFDCNAYKSWNGGHEWRQKYEPNPWDHT